MARRASERCGDAGQDVVGHEEGDGRGGHGAAAPRRPATSGSAACRATAATAPAAASERDVLGGVEEDSRREARARVGDARRARVGDDRGEEAEREQRGEPKAVERVTRSSAVAPRHVDRRQLGEEHSRRTATTAGRPAAGRERPPPAATTAPAPASVTTPAYVRNPRRSRDRRVVIAAAIVRPKPRAASTDLAAAGAGRHRDGRGRRAALVHVVAAVAPVVAVMPVGGGGGGGGGGRDRETCDHRQDYSKAGGLRRRSEAWNVSRVGRRSGAIGGGNGASRIGTAQTAAKSNMRPAEDGHARVRHRRGR